MMGGRMMGGWGNGYGYGGYGGYGMGMGFLMPLIFGIVVILLVVYLFRRSNFRIHSGGYQSNNKGLDILRERYARGEIDTAEFQSRKQDLENR